MQRAKHLDTQLSSNFVLQGSAGDTFFSIHRSTINIKENMKPVESSQGIAVFEGGDKVFVISEKKLATVLNVYGDGVNGNCGDIRLDLCGNTAIADIEPYNPEKHAEFDHTFTPIKKEWKENYGITKDIPMRDEEPSIPA